MTSPRAAMTNAEVLRKALQVACWTRIMDLHADFGWGVEQAREFQDRCKSLLATDSELLRLLDEEEAHVHSLTATRELLLTMAESVKCGETFDEMKAAKGDYLHTLFEQMVDRP